jgi:hypothetical protein
MSLNSYENARKFADRMMTELETDLGVHHDEPFLRMSKLRLRELRNALKGLLEERNGPSETPICDGHASAWFCERNHLKGDHGCVVCAFLGNVRGATNDSAKEPK